MTYVSETSLNAFIEEEHNIRKMRELVVHILDKSGPLTANELTQEILVSLGINRTNNNVRSYLSAVQKSGLIRKIGTRKCTTNNKTVYVWERSPKTALGQTIERLKAFEEWKARTEESIQKQQKLLEFKIIPEILRLEQQKALFSGEFSA